MKAYVLFALYATVEKWNGVGLRQQKSLSDMERLFNHSTYARSTFPDLKQEVHTYIFLAPFSVLTLTDFTFDFHILLDLLWE